MRAKTLQISWHPDENNKNHPILSVDVHPTLPLVVTGGADHEIKLWRLLEDEDPSVSWNCEFITSLTGHLQTVNVVRFSPDGSTLASAGDDKAVMLWRPKERKKTWDRVKAERHVQKSLLAGHSADVYDVCWSPTSEQLLSGAINQQIIIWNVADGKPMESHQDHAHYVQGMAWDPQGQHIATQSSDRTVRVYVSGAKRAKLRGHKYKHKAKQRQWFPMAVIKARDFAPAADGTADAKEASAAASPTTPAASGSGAGAGAGAGSVPAAAASSATTGDKKVSVRHRMFRDETVPSFFRRLEWLIDGSALLAPCGQFTPSPAAPTIATTYGFLRPQLDKPAFQLPCGEKPSVGVRCSPVFYKLREVAPTAGPGLLKAPYRMIFAVVTLDSVLIYDTQQRNPIAMLKNLHYEKLTDVAWSSDGQTLVMSSIDGYCSLVVFDDGELGEPLPASERPAFILKREKELAEAKAKAAAEAAEAAAAAERKREEEDVVMAKDGEAAPPSSSPTPAAESPSAPRLTFDITVNAAEAVAAKTRPPAPSPDSAAPSPSLAREESPKRATPGSDVTVNPTQKKRRRITPMLLTSADMPATNLLGKH